MSCKKIAPLGTGVFLFLGHGQANQILGLQPGDVFVHRNVGNLCLHNDLNFMSCLEYAVKELKVSVDERLVLFFFNKGMSALSSYWSHSKGVIG